MSVAILGRGTFEDLYLPVKGKSEWGMDTLTRKMSGARSLLEAFIATLRQGDGYQGYYLQTWEPDDNPDVATITLNYKGLLPGGTPLPDIQSEIVTASGTMSKDYTAENEGKGRQYRKQLLFGEEPRQLQDVYTTGATMEFVYRAAQSTYRYIRQGAPANPFYSAVAIVYTPVIEKARITTADGSIYGIDRQAFFELNPSQRNKLIGFVTRRVIGTPYSECQDTVRVELHDPADPNV